MNALQRDLKKLVPLVESLGKETVAADPHRQRFHLQPPVGWLNDPNGLCVYSGQYHAFFQYGPFDVNGGVKHWGHAVSTDLLHWEQLPVMLYPDEPFDCHGAYSGSALVEDGTMYLYYTGNVKHPGNFDYIKEGRGHNVCLAVSKDGVTLDSKQCLLTNRDYPAGLTCHVRDPKVFAYEGRYYMVLGARTLEDKGEVLVLESTDKLRWTHINTLTTPEPFGYMWECPDLFCLDGQWLNTPAGIAWARELAEVLGFKHICTLTVEEHDKMIGYVSQLCHAIAVSLMCANDNTSLCEYTGDSFRDLTRIARINDKMWAELFLWNKENLISEIDQFSGALNEMRNALVADDREKLEEMFRLSTQRRAAFDKKLPE